MKKQIVVALIVVGLGIVLLAGVKYLQISHAISAAAGHQPPPTPVTTTIARQEIWPRDLEAIGSLAAVQGTTIAAEEAGKVVKIYFESGSSVALGAPLLDLDTAVEEAQLKGLAALAEQAKLGLKRAQSLRQSDTNSEADLEKAQAQAQEAEAAAEATRAIVARKHIKAPFAGMIGIRLVNVGQYLAVGTPLVPLHALDPIYVDFSLPQQALPSLVVGQSVNVALDAFGDKIFEAKLSAMNPQVDLATRTIQIQATLANPEGTLRPGMFARVSVQLRESDQVIAIPSSSISYAPYGNSVYVVESHEEAGKTASLSVSQETVKLGRRRGELVAVLSGLKPGMRVVTSATFMLRSGAPVTLSEGPQPGSDPAPNPADT